MKRVGLVLVIFMMAAVALAFTGCKPKTPAQLTVEIFDRGTDGGRSVAHDNAWTNWVKEKVKKDLNIDVTFIPVGRRSENTDIVNLMASSSAPDLCYTYAADMIASFRDQGGILDLAPYIDKYLPDLKKLLGADPVFIGKDFIYWYSERLIYQDFPLMTTADDFYNQMKSGVVGAFAQNWDLPYRTDYTINEELAKNIPGAKLVPIDVTVNKDMQDKVGLQIFIPSFSKNYVAALQYLNWLAKPENYHLLQVGQEGVNHVLENGVPRIQTRPAGDPWFQNSSQNIDMTMPMNGVEMGSPELNARVLAFSYGSTPPDEIVNAYDLSTRNARAAAVYQATTTVNQYAQTLQDKADALLAQAIRTSASNFDRTWDDGIKDWLASGGQAMIDERTSLYK